MDGMMVPILIAVVVALLAFGVVQVVSVLTDSEKRKLKERLSSEPSSSSAGSAASSILIQEADAGALGRFSFFDKLNRKLVLAFPSATLSRFLMIVAGSGFGALMLVFAVSANIFVAMIAAGIAGFVPFLVVNQKRNKRQKALAEQLPEALDFLSRILKAGHSLSTALQMMGEELPRPLSIEFRRAYDQHSLGQTIDDSLKDMASRIESTDFAFFVTAVLIQRQTGGDLSEVLGNISNMIRQRIRLAQNVKAKTAEGRFTGYILTAFPAVMFVLSYMLNPDYAGVLIKTNTGLMLLGIAFGLCMVGLFVIRKITTVRV